MNEDRIPDELLETAEDGQRVPHRSAPILDQPWQIELYRLGVLKHRLRLEMSGIRFKGPSVLRATNDTLTKNNVPGAPFCTKAQALLALTDYIDEKERMALKRHG